MGGPQSTSYRACFWVVRDPHATICSNLRNGHATTVAEAEGFLEEAPGLVLGWASGAWQLDGPLVVVRYEDIVADVDAVIARMADAVGVAPWVWAGPPIYDGNAQYGGVDPYDLEGNPPARVEAVVAGRKGYE